jgi:hypothetical protein
VLEDADSDAERTQNVSKRRTQVEKRLDLAFLRMSQSQPDRETTEADRKLFIKQQLNAAKVFKLKPSDEKLLRGYVYDKGLLGTANKDLMDDLYDDLGIPDVALAVQDKVDVSAAYADSRMSGD